MEDVRELIEIRNRLENRINNYFKGGQVYTGDEGYQDLLVQVEELNEEIEELVNK